MVKIVPIRKGASFTFYEVKGTVVDAKMSKVMVCQQGRGPCTISEVHVLYKGLGNSVMKEANNVIIFLKKETNMLRISQCFVLWFRDFGSSCLFIDVVSTTFRNFPNS